MKRYVLIIFLFSCILLPCLVFAQQHDTITGISLLQPEQYRFIRPPDYIFRAGTVHNQALIDSLYSVLKTNKEDTNKVITLNKLSWKIMNTGNYSKADSLSENALQLAEKLNFKKGQATAYNNIGGIYWFLDDYPDALKNYFAAQKILEEIGDKQGIASSYNNIGLIYWKQGDYSNATKNYSIALKIDEGIDNKAGMAGDYVNIGCIYFGQDNYAEALKNMLQSLKMDEEIGNKQGIANVHINMGCICQVQGNYPEALKNYLQGLKIAKEVDAEYSITNNYESIGSLLIKQKKYAEAKKYLDSARILSKDIGDKDVIKNTYSDWTTLDSATGNYKAECQDYKMYMTYRDSIINQKTTQIEISYAFERREDSIKAEYRQENIIKTVEIKRKKILNDSVIIILALTLISAILFINSQQVKRKKDKIISENEKTILTIEKQHMEGELLNAKKSLEDYVKSIIEKNELLEQFKTDMEKLKNLKSKELEDVRIEQLEHLNKTTILTEDDWNKFKELFEQVYKGFFIRLKEKLPNLTQAELRLICLTKLKLNTKQMASILGISYDTIKIARYRLRKKFGLSKEDSIADIDKIT